MIYFCINMHFFTCCYMENIEIAWESFVLENHGLEPVFHNLIVYTLNLYKPLNNNPIKQLFITLCFEDTSPSSLSLSLSLKKRRILTKWMTCEHVDLPLLSLCLLRRFLSPWMDRYFCKAVHFFYQKYHSTQQLSTS